ncbi:hypothetical protein PATSB16_06910 [Pandoraea thiooxydans]|nr:hypothetical protein PATSB16_06910 [Pandoraea thiooxydans]
MARLREAIRWRTADFARKIAQVKNRMFFRIAALERAVQHFLRHGRLALPRGTVSPAYWAS